MAREEGQCIIGCRQTRPPTLYPTFLPPPFRTSQCCSCSCPALHPPLPSHLPHLPLVPYLAHPPPSFIPAPPSPLQAITVLQLFLSSSKPVLRFAAVRTLNKV